MGKRATEPKAKHKVPDATATQAGLEKGLFDELTKGLRCAAQSLTALEEQEHLTLLIEAEIAYQNALCMVVKAGVTRRSPTARYLHRLGAFLEMELHETHQERTNNDTFSQGSFVVD